MRKDASGQLNDNYNKEILQKRKQNNSSLLIMRSTQIKKEKEQKAETNRDLKIE